jgi:hypothetical protein
LVVFAGNERVADDRAIGVPFGPETPAPAPRSLASVRPFGLPLLRLGRGSAGAGIEPAPTLPRGTLGTAPPGRAAIAAQRSQISGRPPARSHRSGPSASPCYASAGEAPVRASSPPRRCCRGGICLSVVPSWRPGRQASRTAGPHHFASQNRDPHRR